MYAEVNRRTISPYTEDGEWMDGDVRVISEELAQTIAIDADDIEDYGSAVDAMVAYLRPLESFEPSSWPIPDETPEHVWLGGTYAHPYDNTELETTVRVYECTPTERAEIFQRVTK